MTPDSQSNVSLCVEAPRPALEIRRRERLRWDAVARSIPDFYAAASTRYYRRCEIALIGRCVGPLTGKRVLKLDLWNEAINTRILNWMSSQGCEAYGLDVSREVTFRARKNSLTDRMPLHLAQADVRDLPFGSRSFDLVYTMGTIEHFEEYQEAVNEIQRVLKPGGMTILGVPHKWNIFLRPLLVKLLEAAGKYPYAPEKSFSAGELRRVVERSGLHVTRRTGIMTLPGIIRMADLFFYRRNIPVHRLTPLLLWPFDRLETCCAWPGYFGYLIVLVGEKH